MIVTTIPILIFNIYHDYNSLPSLSHCIHVALQTMFFSRCFKHSSTFLLKKGFVP